MTALLKSSLSSDSRPDTPGLYLPGSPAYSRSLYTSPVAALPPVLDDKDRRLLPESFPILPSRVTYTRLNCHYLPLSLCASVPTLEQRSAVLATIVPDSALRALCTVHYMDQCGCSVCLPLVCGSYISNRQGDAAATASATDCSSMCPSAYRFLYMLMRPNRRSHPAGAPACSLQCVVPWVCNYSLPSSLVTHGSLVLQQSENTSQLRVTPDRGSCYTPLTKWGFMFHTDICRSKTGKPLRS